MSKPEPVRMWAILRPDGALANIMIDATEEDASDLVGGIEAVHGFKGYRAVQVEVRIVEDE